MCHMKYWILKKIRNAGRRELSPRSIWKAEFCIIHLGRRKTRTDICLRTDDTGPRYSLLTYLSFSSMATCTNGTVLSLRQGVKHLLYVPNYIFNHRHKYDSLYISYDEPIRPVAGDHGVTLYDGCKHAVGGPLILDFVNAAAKYSGYDVADILKEIQRKSDWYDEKYGKNGSNGVEEH